MTQFTTWLRRAFPVCLWVACFTGCAAVPPNGSGVHPGQQALIGKTKQELLACAGPPVSESTRGDRVVFLYYKEASLLEESFPGSKSSFAKEHHGCLATLSLQNDRVSEVHYESVPSSYQDEDHCEEIFDPCASQ